MVKKTIVKNLGKREIN